ncbi:EndoU domain-containing protein [Listeria cossartiae]|uniref:EndoU domain-containing protein n=1 Tax=Listeria cossartiae TaxID=2838249 RepID=UPI0035CB91FE
MNGGHGQSNINYLKKNNIKYNVVKEFPNGVKIGNVPSHKNKMKRSGAGQSWFPEKWKDIDIQNEVTM